MLVNSDSKISMTLTNYNTQQAEGICWTIWSIVDLLISILWLHGFPSLPPAAFTINVTVILFLLFLPPLHCLPFWPNPWSGKAFQKHLVSSFFYPCRISGRRAPSRSPQSHHQIHHTLWIIHSFQQGGKDEPLQWPNKTFASGATMMLVWASIPMLTMLLIALYHCWYWSLVLIDEKECRSCCVYPHSWYWLQQSNTFWSSYMSLRRTSVLFLCWDIAQVPIRMLPCDEWGMLEKCVEESSPLKKDM